MAGTYHLHIVAGDGGLCCWCESREKRPARSSPRMRQWPARGKPFDSVKAWYFEKAAPSNLRQAARKTEEQTEWKEAMKIETQNFCL
jgi:hypothetical protein